MNPHIITVLVLFSLLSNCATKDDKTDDARDNVNQITQVDTFFRGGGNEPGWRVLLMKNTEDELVYDLLLDYGERQITGFASEIKSDSKSHTQFVLETKSKKLTLNVSEEHCIDDGDFEFTHTVLLTDSKFRFFGCGRYMENSRSE